mgnify:FL=1
MYDLIIMDLQGGAMGKNGVHEKHPTAYDAFKALFTWIDKVGKHLPVQYSGYKYSWRLTDPKGREVI